MRERRAAERPIDECDIKASERAPEREGFSAYSLHLISETKMARRKDLERF